MSFLLNVVSCVCVLPPEDVLVLPELDSRLLPAFGALCASEPELRRLYPDVGGAAVKAMLEEKTMQSLFELATEVGADVTACTSKDGVIEILLTSERDVVPTQATTYKGVVEEVVRTPLPTGKGPAPAVVAPIPAPPVGSTSTDFAVLMTLYIQTNGPPEKKGRLWTAAKGGWRNRRGWGTSAPLGDWYGVTVDSRGRVIELKLSDNDLRGASIAWPVVGDCVQQSWNDYSPVAVEAQKYSPSLNARREHMSLCTTAVQPKSQACVVRFSTSVELDVSGTTKPGHCHQLYYSSPIPLVLFACSVFVGFVHCLCFVFLGILCPVLVLLVLPIHLPSEAFRTLGT